MIYIFSDLKLSYNCVLYGYLIFPFIIYGIRPVLKKFFFKGVKIYFTLAGVFKVSKGGVGAIQRILSSIKEIYQTNSSYNSLI